MANDEVVKVIARGKADRARIYARFKHNLIIIGVGGALFTLVTLLAYPQFATLSLGCWIMALVASCAVSYDGLDRLHERVMKELGG